MKVIEEKIIIIPKHKMGSWRKQTIDPVTKVTYLLSRYNVSFSVDFSEQENGKVKATISAICKNDHERETAKYIFNF